MAHGQRASCRFHVGFCAALINKNNPFDVTVHRGQMVFLPLFTLTLDVTALLFGG